jgi:hypothetical protein
MVRWARLTTQDNLSGLPVGVHVLEFLRDRVMQDPDFGERISEHVRGAHVPATDIEMIWSFDPATHRVEVLAPRPEDFDLFR